jgi:hypothetical protein
MSDPQKEPDSGPNANDPVSSDNDGGLLSSIAPELSLYLRRIKILFVCWTIPFGRRTVNTFTKDDGASARAFALIIIAALTFAVRGDDPSEEARATLAGGTAIALTIILNLISRAFRVSLRDQIVISAYASTIVVMFLFVLCRRVLIEYFPGYYNQYSDITVILFCAGVAGLAAFALLLLKSKLQGPDGIGDRGVWHGAALTAGSTIILLIIAFMKREWFADFLHSMKFLGNLGGS